MRHDTRGHGSKLEIDDSASYMFASQGLEIDFGEEPPPTTVVDQPLTAYVEIGSHSFDCPLVSLERGAEGLTACLSVSGWKVEIAQALISDAPTAVLILGEQFNARIFKLEFERAYLSLSR